MPFQSEKQRRYLWANEPEIARDWTDTYGSGIARALGGRIGLRRGSGPGPGGQGARGQATQNPGTGGGGGPPGGGDKQMTYTAPRTPHYKEEEETKNLSRKFAIQEDIRKREAEKDYTPKGIRKTGPQLSWAGGTGPNLGNWASGFAGSKIGGGLGSMLFGPWGALLGALFGRGVGKRAYTASQTPEKETWKDIAFGENTLLSNLLNKKKTPITGDVNFDPNARISDTSFSPKPGIEGINLRDQAYDKLKTIDPRMGMYGPRALGLNPNDLLQDRRKRGTRLDVPIKSGQMDRSAWSGSEAPTMKGRTLDDVYGLYGSIPEFREFDQWEGTQAQQEDPYVRGFDLAPIPSEEDLMYGDTLWQR